MMDGLRPLNSLYWQGLSLEAKRRFLRHLRPWWDVHRHRLAPQAAARIEIMMRDGELTVCRGRLARFALEERDGFPVTVTWRSPGSRGVTERGVHHVVNCMGLGGDPTRSHSALIQHLLAGGLARPHVLRVGFDVDADGRLIDSDGAVATRLFALGPPTRGFFWESTAVPDIREYAFRLADTALRSIDAD